MKNSYAALELSDYCLHQQYITTRENQAWTSWDLKFWSQDPTFKILGLEAQSQFLNLWTYWKLCFGPDVENLKYVVQQAYKTEAT